ncbi:hypothetical protein [Rhodovulum euryhalinum]|uniref:Uncharacterized protein n=1 Tax=Rhodovulum euryhalinum TaxID=35805 RepID=A0A4R2KAH4_9RHOB|nr:hypothetical protein [Rhodovulum euryhalinum]TCO69007.1 hypothetical protein EV655_1193 [Rhodovulum euryhalinum]
MTLPFIALVGPGETFDPATHARKDLTPFQLRISQREEEYARADLEIENPKAGLSSLDGSRVFISLDGVLLFDGEVETMPRGSLEETVEVGFVGKPGTADLDLASLLESLKTAPYWDALCVPEGEEDNPSEVLAGHGLVLAWPRDGGQVQAADPLSGARTLVLTPFEGSLDVQPIEPVPHQVMVKLSVQFTQLGVETFTLTSDLFPLETMCADTLLENWPGPGASLGDGFRIRESTIEEDGDREIVQVLRPVASDELDPVWIDAGTVPVRYEVATLDGRLRVEHRYKTRRIETAEITVAAGIQQSLRSGEVEEIEIGLRDIAGVSDIPAWRPQAEYSAGDQVVDGASVYEAREDHTSGTNRDPSKWFLVGETSYVASRRADSFLRTDRGRAVIQHAIERARARLRYLARNARVSFDCPMPDPSLLDHDCMASVQTAQGMITGRVVSYTLSWSGEGEKVASVEIEAAIGTGSDDTFAWSEIPGVPAYSGGRVSVSVSGRGEDQRNAATEGDDIPETVIRIEPVAAPAVDFEHEVEYEVSGEISVPRQIEI